MHFKTDVDVSLYDFEITSRSGEKRTVGLLNGKATIFWGLEIEVRSWGVKGISVFVPDQVVSAEIEVDDEGEESYLLNVDLPLKDVNVDFQSSLTGPISPHEISFHRNKWEAT